MSEQKTLWGDEELPCSPAAAAGKKPSKSRGGRRKEKSGVPLAHALQCPPPAKRKPAQDAVERTLSLALDELATSYAAYAATHGLPTPDISGLKSGVSSGTEDLGSSWVSKSVDAMERFGSPEYELRWSCLVMASGPSILRRAASVRLIKDSASSGGLFATTTPNQQVAPWPTPTECSSTQTPEQWEARNKAAKERNPSLGAAERPLELVAQLVGYPTPRVQDSKSADQPTSRRGVVSPPHLCAAAKEWFDLHGWPTPMAGAEKTEENNAAGNSDYSRAVEASAPISGWNSPTAGDSKDRDYQYPGGDKTAEPYLCLPGQAKLCDEELAGWTSPRASDLGRKRTEEALERAKEKGGSRCLDDDVQQVQLAGWPTPCTNPEAPNKNSNCVNGPTSLGEAVQLAEQEVIPTGWGTPSCRDAKDGTSGDLMPNKMYLGQMAQLAAEEPPNRDPSFQRLGKCQYRCTVCGQTGEGRGNWRESHRQNCRPGPTPESSTAATGRTGALVLRPGFSLWLMLGRDAQKWLNSSPFFSSAEHIRSWLSDFYASRPATEPES